MMIETCSNARLLVTLEADELRGYGISFRRMNLCDGATRTMLRDLLSVMTHLGLRRENQPTQVECAPNGLGGCSLLLGTLTGSDETYRFADSDDVIAAAQSDALPDGFSLTRETGGGWLLSPDRPLGKADAALLREFGEQTAP